MAKPKTNGKPVDVFDAFALDLEAEKAGRWIYNARPGLDLLVARAGNPAYQEAFEAKMRDEEDVISSGDLDTATSERIITECIAETILVGWKGLLWKGQELEYTKENSLLVLSPPEMKDFRNYIWRLANNAENFRQRAIKADAKN